MPNRNVKSEMWNDPQVFDNFTRTDIDTWLYLITSPNTLLCGIVQGSLKMMAMQCKMDKEEFMEGINRLENVHKMIKFNESESEILIINWHKHNWTTSDRLKTSVIKSLSSVKTKEFVDYVIKTLELYPSKEKENSDKN